MENALPFRVRVKDQGSIESVGYEDMNGLLDFPVIAHPKVDRKTGDLMTLGYILDDSNCDARYAVFRPTNNGGKIEKKNELRLKFKQKVMIHDMAITETYTVVPEFSLAFKPKDMVTNDQVFQLDYNSSARFHVFPRHATSQDQITIFDLGEPGMGFHLMNAYDDDNKNIVRVVGCTYCSLSFVTLQQSAQTHTLDYTTRTVVEHRFHEQILHELWREGRDGECNFGRVDVGFEFRSCNEACLVR